MKPGDNTFQSTPSVWRETYNASEYDLMWGISIHSLRMEGDGAITTPGYVGDISIHSLRMEGDCRSPIAALRILHFNPLPPHGGRLCDLVLFSPLYISFQSTPSAWRETRSPVLSLDLDPISIHSLRMEGDAIPIRDAPDAIISIHSLRMEGDDRLSITTICRICISIHSLRMEGD